MMPLDELIEILERTVTGTPHGNPILTEATRSLIEDAKVMREALIKAIPSLQLAHDREAIGNIALLQCKQALAKVEGGKE